MMTDKRLRERAGRMPQCVQVERALVLCSCAGGPLLHSGAGVVLDRMVCSLGSPKGCCVKCCPTPPRERQTRCVCVCVCVEREISSSSSATATARNVTSYYCACMCEREERLWLGQTRSHARLSLCTTARPPPTPPPPPSPPLLHHHLPSTRRPPPPTVRGMAGLLTTTRYHS
jgi:hypothetical protein